MSFKIEHIIDKTRIGIYKSLKTPFLYLNTKGGVIPYLMREYIDKIPYNIGICINFGDIYPFIPILNDKINIKKLLNYEGINIHIQLRDPLSFHIPKTNNNSCSFNTQAGRRTITLDEYNKAISLFKPDSYTVLNDEIEYSTGKGRTNESIKRSISWLDNTINNNNNNNINIPIFAFIPGSSDLKVRENICKDISKYKDVDGYQIGGLGTGEPNTIEIIDTVISNLPEDKPRLAIGINHPIDIIKAIKHGIDIIVSNYPYILTETGSASLYIILI